MKKPITMACALVLAGFAQMSVAQQGQPTFDGLDTDKSGGISKEELTALFAGRAEGGGAAGGGGRTPDPDRVFARWDADSNGSISKEEFDGRPRRGGGGGGGGGGQPAR